MNLKRWNFVLPGRFGATCANRMLRCARTKTMRESRSADYGRSPTMIGLRPENTAREGIAIHSLILMTRRRRIAWRRLDRGATSTERVRS